MAVEEMDENVSLARREMEGRMDEWVG